MKLPKLDPYETKVFNDLTSSMTPENALEVLINNVEGDHSQLSPGLLAYGRKAGLIELTEQQRVIAEGRL